MKTCILSFSVFAIIAIYLSSCSKNRCIEGNYDLITETRHPGSFTGVVSEGSFQITIETDTFYQIEVEGESNLINYISTFVSGSDLIIKTRDNRCIDNNYPVKIHAKTPVISKLSLEGSGDIYCNSTIISGFYANISGSGDISAGVNTHYINANISGSGKMTLWGASDEADFNISGSGTIKSYGLIQDTCYATISGSGIMYVTVNDLLDVHISGSGSVHYKGNPVILANITGSGLIIHE